MSGGERVHSLVITLGDVMGSQQSLFSTHSCVTLESLTGVIRQVFMCRLCIFLKMH